MSMSDEVLLLFLQSAPKAAIDNLPERLLKLAQINQAFDYFPLMTLDQLEQLARLAESDKAVTEALLNSNAFPCSLLQKKFPIRPEFSYAETQAVLRDVSAFVASRNLPGKYKREVLHRSLILGLFAGDMSVAEFKEYLQLTENNPPRYTDEYLESIDALCPVVEWDKVREEYENAFLGKESGFEKFYPNGLQLKIAESRMLSGMSVDESELPSDSLTEFMKRKELEFELTNPRYFANSAKVSLTIRRKNIKKLTITVIEVASERYFRSNFGSIPANLDLDGIEGKYKIEIENSDSPLVRVTERVEIPELQDQCGLFVIEVMGGGLHARAWVHKCALRHTIVPSESGYQVYIYSQDGELLRTNHTGVMLNGELYLQENSDFTLIPYPEETVVDQSMVLVSGNSAEFVGAVTFEPADYELRAAFLWPEDCIASKRDCSVHVSLRLFLNGRDLPLSKISKITAEVKSKWNYESSSVKKVEVESGASSFFLNFTFPEEYDKLSISLSAHLLDQTAPQLTTSKEFLISRKSSIYDLYLVRKISGYEFQVIGKNGENFPGISFRVHATSLYSRVSTKSILVTDSRGVIDLGSLKDVLSIEATDGKDVKTSFNVKNLEEEILYPKKITVAVGDTVEVPVVHYRTELQALLIRKEKYAVVSRNKLIIDHDRHCVTLSGLEEGLYILLLPYESNTVEMRIAVVSGANIEGGYVLTRGSAVHVPRGNLPLGVASVTVRNSSAKIRLNGNCANAQLILKLSNFPEALHFPNFRADELQAFPLSNTTNLYLSGRLLDDEYRYILDRKTTPHRPGISYPLPSLLIHPKLEHGTVTDDRIPAEGIHFIEADAGMKEESEEPYQDSFENDTPSYDSFGSHAEFVSVPGRIVSQISVDQNCEATVALPDMSAYLLLTVIAVKGEAAAGLTVPISDHEVLKRDLRLSASFDSEKAYAEVRSMEVRRKGEVISVGGMMNATTAIIDSIDALMDVFLQYLNDLKDWKFLKDWDRLSVAEKESKYVKFSGHELNLFLYYKDKAFFDTHVKPAISVKFEKTFIDDFLLDKPLQKYAAYPMSLNLSGVELALLAKKTRNEKIVALLKDKKSVSKLSLETAYELFTIVFQTYPKKISRPFKFDREFLFRISPSVSISLSSFSLFMKAKSESNASEYSETQYLTSEVALCSYEFWAEVAASDSHQPILSESVLFAHLSIGEAVMALAMIDLPLYTPKLAFNTNKLSPLPSNAIVLRKDIQIVPENLSDSISVWQCITDEDGNEPKQFVKSRKYTAKIFISNVSQKAVEVEVLKQVPTGSIPISTRSVSAVNVMELQPQSIDNQEYSFYFPEAGAFTHAAVYIAIDGVVVQRSAHRDIIVADKETLFDENSFSSLARKGDLDQIESFLSTKNLAKVNFSEILWLLKDATAFKRITGALRNRLVFEQDIWLFSIEHGFELELSELLQADSSTRSLVSCPFHSRLVSFSGESMQYLEYFPMVNARVNSLGEHPRIANTSFRGTYVKFLRCLAEKDKLDWKDRLTLALYLVLQNRYEEAQQQLDLIAASVEGMDSVLQYDYLRAYLNDSLVPEVLQKYENITLSFWKPKFAEMRNQFEEREMLVAESTLKSQLLSVTLVESTLRIYSEQIPKCELHAHKVDLELLFSRSPFLLSKPQLSQYSPANFSATIPLLSGFLVNYTLPHALERLPLLLALDCGPQSWSALYLNSPLRVQVYSSVGLIRVTTDKLEPVRGAYVKVYVRSGGLVKFLKDGYTDVRGKFDYLSVARQEVSKEFSVFVEKEGVGAAVIEISKEGN